MKRIVFIITALAVFGLVVTGCSKPSETPAQTAKPAQNQPAQTQPEVPKPTVTSFSGKSADGKLEVKVNVTGKVASVEMIAKDFTWKAPPAKDAKNAPNEGHASLTLDSEKPKNATGMRNSFTDLKPGKHTLKVGLMNNDKTPMNVEATVEFEVK